MRTLLDNRVLILARKLRFIIFLKSYADVPFSRLQTTLFALMDSKMTLVRDQLRMDHPCSYKHSTEKI